MPTKPKTTFLAIRLEDSLKARLDAESARTGATRAEIVRRALTSYLNYAEVVEETRPKEVLHA